MTPEEVIDQLERRMMLLEAAMTKLAEALASYATREISDSALRALVLVNAES